MKINAQPAFFRITLKPQLLNKKMGVFSSRDERLTDGIFTALRKRHIPNFAENIL